MNQNNINKMTAHTGGHIAGYSSSEEPEVKIPEPEKEKLGFAKASPNFKKLEAKPIEKTEEQKAIAESIIKDIK